LQPLVMDNVANQIAEGNNSIVGLMVESHIGWGSQPINKDLSQLQYGVSITDACIDWDTTVKAVRSMHAKVKDVLPQRKRAWSRGPMDPAAGPARDPAPVLSQPAGGTCNAPCRSRKGSPCNPAPLRTSAPRLPAVLPAPCPATPAERRYDRYPLSVYPDP